MKWAAFRGEMPIYDPRLLPDQNGQVARNVYLRHGTLKPLAAPGPAAGLPAMISPTSLYRYPYGNNGAGHWFAWGGGKDVDIVKSPLANDAFARVYWTGDGYPKMGAISNITKGSPPYPSSFFRLGVPPPTKTPSVTAQSGRPTKSKWPSTTVDTAYIYTHITAFGEESAPSNPSAIVQRWDTGGDNPAGGGVVLTLGDIAAGPYDIVTKRIYRAESGGSYLHVGDLQAGAIAFTDTVKSAALGAACPSIGWDMPDAAMRGLTEMGSGMLAGFFGNTLAFCEAYYPHAWPVDYQLAFADNIVAIGLTSAGLIVTTTGRPWLVTGSTPAAMAAMQLDVDQPCIASRSLVDMGDYVLYASQEGLVAAGGNQAQVASATMMSRAQWQAYRPDQIHGYRYEGRYLGFYPGGSFAFSPGEGFEFYDITASGAYHDVASNIIYLIQGNAITAWEQGSVMTLRWRSRRYDDLPRMTCARVIARGYPVTLRLYADGVMRHERVVASREVFRLPALPHHLRDWEVELSGDREINSVALAGSPAGLE